jgi:hypothetical protein
MERVFTDNATETEFRRKGYVVLPFLDAGEIAALGQLHDVLPPEAPADFYATVFSRNADYRRRISDGIGAILANKLDALFPRHELCFGLFVTKQPMTQRGRLPLHRDYSFVDQSVHIALNLWCPLVDVDEQNGCLHVVPGSQTLMPSPFAVNEYPSPFHPVMDLLNEKYTRKIVMPAGSIVAYDSRLLHGSGENRSNRVRPACTCILVPKGVRPRVYVWDGQRPTRFDVLEVTRDYLLRLERGAAIKPPYPEGVTYLTSADYSVTALRPQDLVALNTV